MSRYEYCGWWFHICDVCGKDDGRRTLYWDKPNFDICYECLSNLYFQHVAETEKRDENIIVKRRAISEELRNKVLKRDGGKCVYCGATQNLQMDHKIPFSKGGTTKFDNLQTVCKKCNLAKRNR